MKKAAITTWEGRVSPLCDAARTLSVFNIEGEEIICEEKIQVDPDRPFVLVSTLSELQVDTLICGAISQSLSTLMSQYRIRVIAFVNGQVQQVLDAFCRNRLDRPGFRMPGYGRGRRQQFSRQRGCRRRRSESMFNL